MQVARLDFLVGLKIQRSESRSHGLLVDDQRVSGPLARYLLQEAGHHHQEGEEGDPCQEEGVHPWEQEAVVQEVVPEVLVLGLEDHQGVDPEVEEVLNGDFVTVIAR